MIKYYTSPSNWQFALIFYPLHFAFTARTSRNTLEVRDNWYFMLSHTGTDVVGVGEFGIIPGLSPEDTEDYSVTAFQEKAYQTLASFIDQLPGPDIITNPLDCGIFIQRGIPPELPAIRFAAETAYADFVTGGKQVIFKSDFTEGTSPITINGLIWIDEVEKMKQEILKKGSQGFKTLKLKISNEGWEQEFELLNDIRKAQGESKYTFRVDANEAFQFKKAREVMNDLHAFGVHSIEQPIKKGRWEQMASLCKNHPLPVALDEELIGLTNTDDMREMLITLGPQYLVLKPSLVGGFIGCRAWIKLAEQFNIKWWITSALESNIGLNAIAQFTATYQPELPQGLGTGQIYTNNIDAPLELEGQDLRFNPEKSFNWPPFLAKFLADKSNWK